jgi:hypothetical protein
MLGHIIYMCLAGGHPFGGVPTLEAEKMHQAGLPSLLEYNANVPEDFLIWIEKLTQLNPENRPASAVVALNSLPKVSRPTNAHSTQVRTVTANLNLGSPTQLQSPASNITGPLSGIMPAGQNVLAATEILPVAKQKGSNKALFMSLGIGAIIVMIIVLMNLFGGNNEDKRATAKTAKTGKIGTAASASSGKRKSYAERHAVKAEKIIIANFDGTKPAAHNRDWLYLHKTKQKVTEGKDGWSITNDKGSKIYPGIRFPLKSNENDMLDFGWKLTYIVRPVKGKHRLGFHIDENINPGWEGGAVSLYLAVEHTAEGKIKLSAMDANDKVKSSKSITVSYKGAKDWHTIVIEQQPGNESGAYSVSIDSEAAFEDTFTTGKDLKSWNNHLFSSALSKDSGSQWAIKELKLETP